VCKIVKQKKHARFFHKAPLKPLTPPATIFDVWHIDYISLPYSKGYKYALVIIDSLSLFSLILPAKTETAEETVYLLYHHLFMMFGARVLLSDRGAAFRSKLVRALCSLLGTTQIYTSSRHSQTNSRAESHNKNILNSLRTKLNSKKWPELLSLIAFFRTSVVKSIGILPYQVVFGKELRFLVDNLLLPAANVPKTTQAYFEKIKPELIFFTSNCARKPVTIALKHQKILRCSERCQNFHILSF